MSLSAPSTTPALLALLDEARRRTLELITPLSDEDLRRQHDPLMSPVLWDLGHIAHFEELWLTQNLDGEIRFAEMPGMYNPFEHPRRVRDRLLYPTREECVALMAAIRERVLAKLDHVDFDSDRATARRWLRGADGGAARVPARRDDPADAPAEAGGAVPPGAPAPRGGPTARHPVRQHGALSRRAGEHRHRRSKRRLRQRAPAPRRGR